TAPPAPGTPGGPASASTSTTRSTPSRRPPANCAAPARPAPGGGAPAPAPRVRGGPPLHAALTRYNNACWYVHEVVTLAGRYTRAAPPEAPARDPFGPARVAAPAA